MKTRILLIVAVALLMVAGLTGAVVTALGSGDASDEAGHLVASAGAAPVQAADEASAPGGADGDDAQARTAVAPDGAPHLGVVLGAQPLPALLVEHLRLQPGQGLVVDNVLVGSPADAAGLDRDDLILSLDGEPVREARAFIDAIATASVGEVLELEVMHEGQRRTVEVELAARPSDEDVGALGWKFPERRQQALSMAPGGALPPGLGLVPRSGSMLPGDLQGLLDEMGAQGFGAPADADALRQRAEQMMRRAQELHLRMTPPASGSDTKVPGPTL